MSPRITLYVDTVSPFAYIAYHVLRNDPAFRKVEVTYVPILLGGLMKMCDNRPPLLIKNKDKWMVKERLRWSNIFNVPMNPATPPNFPPKTLNIMRALTPLSQADLTTALDKLWEEFFVKHTATNDPTELERILPGAQAKVTEADKKLLSERTEEAFRAGAFGLPWMVCTNDKGETEGFWGVDHFGQVCNFLGLERPGAGGWKALL